MDKLWTSTSEKKQYNKMYEKFATKDSALKKKQLIKIMSIQLGIPKTEAEISVKKSFEISKSQDVLDKTDDITSIQMDLPLPNFIRSEQEKESQKSKLIHPSNVEFEQKEQQIKDGIQSEIINQPIFDQIDVKNGIKTSKVQESPTNFQNISNSVKILFEIREDVKEKAEKDEEGKIESSDLIPPQGYNFGILTCSDNKSNECEDEQDEKKIIISNSFIDHLKFSNLTSLKENKIIIESQKYCLANERNDQQPNSEKDQENSLEVLQKQYEDSFGLSEMINCPIATGDEVQIKEEQGFKIEDKQSNQQSFEIRLTQELQELDEKESSGTIRTNIQNENDDNQPIEIKESIEKIKIVLNNEEKDILDSEHTNQHKQEEILIVRKKIQNEEENSKDIQQSNPFQNSTNEIHFISSLTTENQTLTQSNKVQNDPLQFDLTKPNSNIILENQIQEINSNELIQGSNFINGNTNSNEVIEQFNARTLNKKVPDRFITFGEEDFRLVEHEIRNGQFFGQSEIGLNLKNQVIGGNSNQICYPQDETPSLLQEIQSAAFAKQDEQEIIQVRIKKNENQESQNYKFELNTQSGKVKNEVRNINQYNMQFVNSINLSIPNKIGIQNHILNEMDSSSSQCFEDLDNNNYNLQQEEQVDYEVKEEERDEIGEEILKSVMGNDNYPEQSQTQVITALDVFKSTRDPIKSTKLEPIMQVRINGYYEATDNFFKKYILFKIETKTENGKIVKVDRRFNNFKDLNTYFESCSDYFGAIKPQLPSQNLTSIGSVLGSSLMDSQLLDQRQFDLESYLKRIVEIKNLAKDKVFVSFLEEKEFNPPINASTSTLEWLKTRITQVSSADFVEMKQYYEAKAKTFTQAFFQLGTNINDKSAEEIDHKMAEVKKMGDRISNIVKYLETNLYFEKEQQQAFENLSKISLQSQDSDGLWKSLNYLQQNLLQSQIQIAQISPKKLEVLSQFKEILKMIESAKFAQQVLKNKITEDNIIKKIKNDKYNKAFENKYRYQNVSAKKELEDIDQKSKNSDQSIKQISNRLSAELTEFIKGYQIKIDNALATLADLNKETLNNNNII